MRNELPRAGAPGIVGQRPEMPPLRSGRPFIPELKSPGFSGRLYKLFALLPILVTATSLFVGCQTAPKKTELTTQEIQEVKGTLTLRDPATVAKGLEINPGDADAYNNQGNAYRSKGQYDQAITDYNKALEINPRYAEAYINRGTTYFRKGQYDQAITDYNKALEINPRNAVAYYNRGIAYSSKGQYDQAITDYNKALEINPRYAEAYYNKASASDKAGRKKETIEALRSFVLYAPATYQSYIEKARKRIKELEK
jgi:lipopolysaccharide biosynthesis regulator YciM